MTVTEFLKDHVPFLKGLTDEEAAALARSAEQKPVEKGQTVIFQGTTVDGLHIVAAGKVCVLVRAEKGKPPTQVAELGPGEVFGETSLVEFTVAGATIKGAEEGTLVFVLPEPAFRRVLESDPALRERTLALIESRKASRKAPQAS